MKNIALFASGSGTNVENIVRYFDNHDEINVSLILSNKKGAYVLERAKKLDIPSYVFDRSAFYDSSQVVSVLDDKGIDFIVLAGFLWLVPSNLVLAFQHRIINIHPALLPKYGGKGMYGNKVHEAVVENLEIESGITIHWVDESYDEGNIILQEKCEVLSGDTANDVAEKVHALEYEFYPKVIERVVLEA